MKKVIITGASGFVGINLSRYLSENNIQNQALSLRDKNWSQNFDRTSNAIVHLAGKAHDTSNTSDAVSYFKINTELTKQLFDLFLDSDCNDFFYFSSVKAVADTVEISLVENTIPNPVTPYGQSKLAAENYILSKEIPQGKRVFIIRPCMIHGPRNKGNLNLLYTIVQKNIPWPLGAFQNKRSFCSIDNLCFSILEFLTNTTIQSGIYNLADTIPISTNELIELIGASNGKKVKIVTISKTLIIKLSKIGDIFKLPINSERLQKLTENYVVSNEKILKAIGKPFPISSKAGLIKTLQSFKK